LFQLICTTLYIVNVKYHLLKHKNSYCLYIAKDITHFEEKAFEKIAVWRNSASKVYPVSNIFTFRKLELQEKRF
jgi:hypothetical protein